MICFIKSGIELLFVFIFFKWMFGMKFKDFETLLRRTFDIILVFYRISYDMYSNQSITFRVKANKWSDILSIDKHLKQTKCLPIIYCNYSLVIWVHKYSKQCSRTLFRFLFMFVLHMMPDFIGLHYRNPFSPFEDKMHLNWD